MAWYDANWNYRLKVTVQASVVDGDLTDYPVYVNLDDIDTGHGFWSHVKSDGGDIRITKSDGTTEVPVEVVFINTTSKIGEVYFKADGTLSGTTDTDFYIYYGNSGASAASTSGTYGRNNVWTAGYQIVAHFQEDPDSASFVNSTGGTSGTYTNLTGLVTGTGSIGNACDFSGGNAGHVAMSTITESDRDYAFSAFIKVASTGVQAAFEYSSTGSTLGGRRVAAMYNANKLNWNHNNAQGYIEPTTTINTGTWYHMSVTASTVDSTHASVAVWINGATKTSNTNYHSIDTDGTECKIGANRVATEELDGLMDEVRYCNVTKSDAWVTTEDNNLRSSSTFNVFAAEEVKASKAQVIFIG